MHILTEGGKTAFIASVGGFAMKAVSYFLNDPTMKNFGGNLAVRSLTIPKTPVIISLSGKYNSIE
jgi:hypothetical protein